MKKHKRGTKYAKRRPQADEGSNRAEPTGTDHLYRVEPVQHRDRVSNETRYENVCSTTH